MKRLTNLEQVGQRFNGPLYQYNDNLLLPSLHKMIEHFCPTILIISAMLMNSLTQGSPTLGPSPFMLQIYDTTLKSETRKGRRALRKGDRGNSNNRDSIFDDDIFDLDDDKFGGGLDNGRTAYPSQTPSFAPSPIPSSSPSFRPSASPSHVPSKFPSSHPTSYPSNLPSYSPSLKPSKSPTTSPTQSPSSTPSFIPSNYPTSSPSFSLINKPFPMSSF